MRTPVTSWALWAMALGAVGLWPMASIRAQEPRNLSVAFSAGGGGVQIRGIPDHWSFGPVLGGRVEWGNRRSAVSLAIDAQPFRAEGPPRTGDFRAVYLLPFYAVGSGGTRFGLGVGLGVFDFRGGTVDEGIETRFVAAASGSIPVPRGWFVQLGWKRIRNLKGLRPDVWTLGVERRWGF